MHNFEFVNAKNICEVVDEIEDEDNIIISGGQTLIPSLKQRLSSPKKIISISKISDIIGVEFKKNAYHIGSATTHSMISKKVKRFSSLSNLANNVGDPAVRNRGTIGGSIANNDPSACYPAAILGTNSKILTNLRTISSDDFFIGMFETKLKNNEIILKFEIQKPLKSNYQKFVQPASRFALVGVFISVYEDHIRVAITGASENGVFRWEEAEKKLQQNFHYKALEDLSPPSQDLIDDIHGSSLYRSHLIKIMTIRAVHNCNKQK